ncbi:GDSL family lipase [Phormidium pseudopriestleyi FRX01]|uniref:GDSL family lipase n=2 Tax=Phormidium TaxID=1198 RepID=A0ABS3FSC0_9CYAN|nr:SGNH/GDSL hydrolase family protein [Phormidium pseudopriestleyi]MBO0349272.1 GDSL family lipase [Phormidium pseudopriestleyi FRX01]
MSWSKIPPWAFLSLATNGILMLTVILLIVRAESSSSDLQNLSELQGNGSSAIENASGSENPGMEPQLGPRHQWNYEQWLAQLQREAEAIAANPPERLGVLAGDSISLWFPPELLPPQRTWLNQGISGEVSSGLLKRLPLFDNSNPEVIFVMIGINDLIRGVSPSEVLENHRAIVRDLVWVHPNARIVVQSILPHSGSGASWEGRDRLLNIPNDRIGEINRELAAIASEEGVEFLDLYPLFADSQGNLRLDLTTDGLHLNEQGYLVWRTALMVFDPI